jgi:predicted dehydrogenase
MTKIRFGIFGSGYMGQTHAEAILKTSNAALVAVAGGTRAPGLAARYGIACEPDAEALAARTDIDAVVVTTPHYRHTHEALLSMESGKHALVEKPLTTSLDDCDKLIAAAERNHVVLSVGYQQRFRMNNVRARDLVRSGAIGDIQTVLISMPIAIADVQAGGFGGNWDWWTNPLSVGHVLNSAPHAIDLLRWFTGADVCTVSSFSRTFRPSQTVEDTTLALIEFSNGMLCSLFSSCALPAPIFPNEDFRIRIMGSRGLIDLDPYRELRMADDNGWRVVSTQPTVGYDDASTAFGDARMQAYRDQIAAFLDVIDGKPPAGGAPLDGRAGVEACLAMLASSREQRWIHLGNK